MSPAREKLQNARVEEDRSCDVRIQIKLPTHLPLLHFSIGFALEMLIKKWCLSRDFTSTSVNMRYIKKL